MSNRALACLNQNGQLILETLKRFNEPVTTSRVVMHLAKTAGIDPDIIKYSVQETLDGGVRFGFIQQSNRKYFTLPVDIPSMPPVATEEPTATNDAATPDAAAPPKKVKRSKHKTGTRRTANKSRTTSRGKRGRITNRK